MRLNGWRVTCVVYCTRFELSRLHYMRACCPCTMSSCRVSHFILLTLTETPAAKSPVMFYSRKCLVHGWLLGSGDWVILSNVFWARKCNTPVAAWSSTKVWHHAVSRKYCIYPGNSRVKTEQINNHIIISVWAAAVSSTLRHFSDPNRVFIHWYAQKMYHFIA